jgi:hypothetical protein
VAQKNLVAQQLKAGKSAVGQNWSGLKKSAAQSQVAQSAKQVGAAAKQTQQQTRQRIINRLLRKGN